VFLIPSDDCDKKSSPPLIGLTITPLNPLATPFENPEIP